jgi:hypothetical protein
MRRSLCIPHSKKAGRARDRLFRFRHSGAAKPNPNAQLRI